MQNRIELLQEWLNLKTIENEAKEKRVALEENIFGEYSDDVLCNGKMSGTMNDGDFKITIKLNPKYKLTDETLVPSDVDIWKQVVDEKKLAEYEDEVWVEKIWNKPTFTVVKTK